MSAFPSLPLFTDAFIADTGHLSAQQTGAYMMLLMMAWRSPGCCLPDDDDKLARWARVDRRTWLRIKPAVMEFWTLSNGLWSQKRLSKERDLVSKRAEVARENGKQGGRPKSLPDNAPHNPEGSLRDTQKKASNPSPNPNGVERRVEPTELNPEKPEPDNAADASRSAGKDRSGKSYAFEAGVIRLNAVDLESWRGRYAHLFLESELASLAAWASQPENKANWFFAVQGALAKRNRDQALAKEVAIAEAQARANAPARPTFWTP